MANPPEDNNMSYSRFVPERWQPITKTGACLRSLGWLVGTVKILSREGRVARLKPLLEKGLRKSPELWILAELIDPDERGWCTLVAVVEVKKRRLARK